MSSKVVLCFIMSFCFLAETTSVCRSGPAPNFCAYNGDESNATETENAEILCDCERVMFCTVVNFSRPCNSKSIQLDLGELDPFLSGHCDALPLEAQPSIPTLELLNITTGTFRVKFPDDVHSGLYTVFCTSPEMSDQSNKTSSIVWEIVYVNPVEVLVDSEVELQLTLSEDEDRRINATSAWCFISTPGNDSEVLSAFQTSEKQVTCAGFTPAVPGVFTVSLSSGFPPDTFEKSISVKGIAKHPVAQRAEYGSEFEAIFVYFDANVESHSSCGDTFPKIFEEYFGVGFHCFFGGNILKVKMGSHFKIISNITLNSDSKICREGSLSAGLCLTVLPANLFIFKPKILGPSLSFFKKDACGSDEKSNYLSLRVIASNGAAFAVQNETFRAESAGKTHRKNLMIWRRMRQFQSKLSSRLILQVNKTDILPLLENLSAFDGYLDVDINNPGAGASVSVHVQSSPAISSLSAEAHVRFCNDSIRLFRYNWVLNGKNLSEEGRLLTLSVLPPGKYLIKCMVVAFDSNEILGQGLTTAEVLENVEEVLVVPAEVALGTDDDIFLRAVTKLGNPVTWTCRTASGSACYLEVEKLPNGTHNFSSLSISLPAGSLPVGIYIWTAESLGRSKSARVLVKPGTVAVTVEISSVFVNPFVDVIINGTVRRARGTCRVGWTSVRQTGFSYLDLRSLQVGVKEVSFEGEHSEAEFPLVISPSSMNPGALQPHSLYMFKLEAFCPQSGSLRYIKVPVRTHAPPVVHPITVEPLAGKAMFTRFEISGAEANVAVQDYPLTLEWSYVDSCGTEIPLGRGLSSRNITTYLPPGDVKIMVRACDGRKLCSTSVSPTVVVAQAPEIHQENFYNSLNQIQYLMSSGDDPEAFGLAATAFRSLSLTAEFKIREKVSSAVEEAVGLRIETLSKKLLGDPQAAKLCLKFSESAETVVKYFRKGSPLLNRLTEFRNNLTEHLKSV